MHLHWRATRLVALCFGVAAAPHADAKLITMPDGLTVYDTVLKVRWLANANLPGTPEGRLDVAGIAPGGAMDYPTALQWLDALNGLNGGSGYLGHSNWTLPTTPTFPATDPSCPATGPHGNSFGFGCTNSDMGSLFYVSLGLHHPDTAVPIPDNTVGPFRNFQPYLYWSDTGTGKNDDGYHTFSFNTGWAGANVDGHYMYVLPMLEGNPFGTTASDGRLQPSADGKTVYDPTLDVTWLADADLATSRRFDAQCTNQDGTQCINPDGSMSHATALNWIAGMNAAAHLGQTRWRLPPDLGGCGEFGCADTPMGNLYYNQLRLPQGTPVVPAPEIDVGPFHHLQPYLYWSCSAPYTNPPCQSPPPAPGFAWSFSFGNGFEGTDVRANDLYVMVYFPEAPAQALADAIGMALGASPELPAFLSQAANIGSAPNAKAKAGALGAFIRHVSAQQGRGLSATEADELILLAQAI